MRMSRRNLLGAATSLAVTGAIINRSIGDDAPGPKMPEPNGITKTLRLGLFQQTPVKWDLKANLAAFLDGVETAATKGVELLVSPECFLDGYAASDPASTRAKLAAVAQDVARSPHLIRVAEAAGKRRMSIVFGFTREDGRAIYNTAALWDARGQLAGIYHKTHLVEFSRFCGPQPAGTSRERGISCNSTSAEQVARNRKAPFSGVSRRFLAPKNG